MRTSDRVPDHVPPALVRAFDHHRDPALSVDPFTAFERYRREPIFWTPAFDGFWVLTRYDDIRQVLHSPDRFSSRQSSIPATGWSRPFIPTELDPPEHTAYRSLLMRCLSGRVSTAIIAALNDACLRVVAGLAATGRCDLVADVARPLQEALFQSLFDVSVQHACRCSRWVAGLLQHADPARRSLAASQMFDYLRTRIRRTDESGRGLLGALARGDIHGQPLTEMQQLDVAFVVALASLDTLAQSINFAFRYLAGRPDLQLQLSLEPHLAPQAAEELLRLHSVVSVARTASGDTDLAGVQIREGDRVLLCLAMAGRDPDTWPTADQAHMGRAGSHRHLAFGAGPHRCPGASIARHALATLLCEWHRRIPAYHVVPRTVITTGAGAVCSLVTLPLAWVTRSTVD